VRNPRKAVRATQCAQIVATPQGKIRWADTQAKLWLKTFLARPERAGLLPRQLCRWLNEIDTTGAGELFVVRRAGQCLLIRAFRPHPAGAVALLLETAQGSARSRNRACITRRETDVHRWIEASKTDSEIAQILNISSSTVGKHIEHLYSKLGVENRTAAASLYPTREHDEDTAATTLIAA
jgi:DNA-binding CsgD family transcriptional regulator